MLIGWHILSRKSLFTHSQRSTIAKDQSTATMHGMSTRLGATINFSGLMLTSLAPSVRHSGHLTQEITVGANRRRLHRDVRHRRHLVICVVNMFVLSAKTVTVALETATSILLAEAGIFALSLPSSDSRSFSTRTWWLPNRILAASFSR